MKYEYPEIYCKLHALADSLMAVAERDPGSVESAMTISRARGVLDALMTITTMGGVEDVETVRD